jgi:hypothetical protein
MRSSNLRPQPPRLRRRLPLPSPHKATTASSQMQKQQRKQRCTQQRLQHTRARGPCPLSCSGSSRCARCGIARLWHLAAAPSWERLNACRVCVWCVPPAAAVVPTLPQVYFLDAPDAADPVVKSHYRMIRSFSADDPAPLVPGDSACGRRALACARLPVCVCMVPRRRGQACC